MASEVIIRTQELVPVNYGPLSGKGNLVKMSALDTTSSPTWANRANVPWIHLARTFNHKQPNYIEIVPYALCSIALYSRCTFDIFAARGRWDTLRRVARVSGTTSRAVLSGLPYKLSQNNISTIGVGSYGVTCALTSAHWFGSCNVTDYWNYIAPQDASGNSGKAALVFDAKGFQYIALQWVTSSVANRIGQLGFVLTGW